MAERRMFAKTITNSDAFLEMPISSQCLYFHLNMNADDDGFVNSPKRIQRMVGASDDDFKILIAKSFILTFESGVIVIKHWRLNNYIQKDRYKETVYLEEKNRLCIKDNKAYTLSNNNNCIQDVYNLYTQVRLGKDSIGNNREIYSDEQQKIFDKIQELIPNLSSADFTKMKWIIDNYNPKEIDSAIKVAKQNDAKNINYIIKVLINGVFKNKKKTSPVPDWIDKEIEPEDLPEEEYEKLKKELEEALNG